MDHDTVWARRFDVLFSTAAPPRPSLRELGPPMRTIIGWLAASIAGAAGWWLGARIGLVTAIVVGGVAGGAGLYYGYRWFDENLK